MLAVDELTRNLEQLTVSTKQRLGQFFTVEHDHILDGLGASLGTPSVVIEPCAGECHLIQWLRKKGYHGPVEAYDIDPKPPVEDSLDCAVQQRDTLLDPPEYTNKFILSNMPYLARNKCVDKTAFDRYHTNDLFKCYLLSFLADPIGPTGGIVIIPGTFFLSPRDLDLRVRSELLRRYRILRVNYFEERVFADTPVTVVAFAFERSDQPLTEQFVPWYRYRGRENPIETKTFHTRADHGWIVGGDIYQLPQSVKIGRQVSGTPLKPNEHLTRMLLRAMDSGTEQGRINLELMDADYVYVSKPTSRSYAMLTIMGRELSEAQQLDVCTKFNELLERKRVETWSLCLPQYRESKEYARKRMPFELAYRMVSYLLAE